MVKKINSLDYEAYFKVWRALNQTDIESIEEESIDYPKDMDITQVIRCFKQNSPYKIISLKSLTQEDKQLLKNMGLSRKYLKLNRQELITQEGVSQKKYQNLPNLQPSDVSKKQRQSLSELSHKLDTQLSMIDEGFIYTFCPYSGKILKSNRSFPLITLNGYCKGFCYRFISDEVFYQIFYKGHTMFGKTHLYFPNQELLVALFNNSESKIIPLHLLNLMKAFFVIHSGEAKSYLLRKDNVKTVITIGQTSIFHYAFNYLSGLQRLSDNDLLSKVDKILPIKSEYYGGIDEIFSEISAEKLERIQDGKTLFKKILENNYFGVNVLNDTVRGCGIHDERLRERLLNFSKNKCSSTFLEKVEKVKKNNFPLLWVTVRLHKRVWLSQVEGLANIIRELYLHFPNLGVVFDGYSRQDVWGNLVDNPREEEIISQEKEIISQIQSLLPQEIPVYNNVGCFMHESLVWANTIDFYCIPGGSSATKMLLFEKPGICHSSHKIANGMNKWMNQKLQYLSNSDITEVNSGETSTDYEFDWKIAYEKLFNIASSLKRDK